MDYRALPRVVQKTAVRSMSEWWKGGHGFRLLLPQGGSTLTQQLVRGYFLQDLTSRTDEDGIFHAGVAPPRILSMVLGASATNKLLRKMEEVRLTLWLEREMRRRYGSQEQAKREIFARYASFIYLGNGRYGFAAASEYYFGRSLSSYTPADAGTPRCWRRSASRRGTTPPWPATGGRHSPQPDPRPDGAQREHPGEPGEALPERTDPRRRPSARSRPTLRPRSSTSSTNWPGRAGVRFGIEDLFQGRIVVRSTVDARVQAIVNDALEHGLALYEKRHPRGRD